jgi:hypothetical protein
MSFIPSVNTFIHSFYNYVPVETIRGVALKNAELLHGTAQGY